MAETDVLFTAGVLFVTFLVALVVLMIALHIARSRIKRPPRAPIESREPITDRTYNTLVTTEAISRELMDKGFENVTAEELLRKARQAYFEGNMEEAEEHSMEARAILNEMRVVEEPPERELAEDEVEVPESKPVMGKEYPRNYLQAKFIIGLVKDSLKKTRKRSENVKKARELIGEAEEAFEQEKFNDALSLAVNSQRLLKDEEIPERAASPRLAEGDHLCPRCETEISPDDGFCGKCGYRLMRSECPECGDQVAEEDNFCRKCGAALRPIREVSRNP